MWEDTLARQAQFLNPLLALRPDQRMTVPEAPEGGLAREARRTSRLASLSTGDMGGREERGGPPGLTPGEAEIPGGGGGRTREFWRAAVCCRFTRPVLRPICGNLKEEIDRSRGKMLNYGGNSLSLPVSWIRFRQPRPMTLIRRAISARWQGSCGSATSWCRCGCGSRGWCSCGPCLRRSSCWGWARAEGACRRRRRTWSGSCCAAAGAPSAAGSGSAAWSRRPFRCPW